MHWRYDPLPDPASQEVACSDTVNRDPAFADGRIYFVTLDSHVVAVDAQTGKELWKVKLGDINKGETITPAPLLVIPEERRSARLDPGLTRPRAERSGWSTTPTPTPMC